MRKTQLFAALFAVLLVFAAFVPTAEAQRWRRGGWTGGGYYYSQPTYYYSTPAYGYADYSVTPSYSYYSAPSYSYDYGYSYPSYSYYSAPAYGGYYYYSQPYYGGYYYSRPYRGYVRTPWVQVGW
jgi:hypothetical protein